MLALSARELGPLSPESAQRWHGGGKLPAHTAVLVFTGEGWPEDRSSEWFASLARRRSLATVQGMEWTHKCRAQVRDDAAVQRHASANVVSLQARSRVTGLGFDHVYVARTRVTTGEDRCVSLRRAITADSPYRVRYDRDGIRIARRL